MPQLYYEFMTDSYPIFVLPVFYYRNTDSAENTKIAFIHVILRLEK